jgi:hypothetical protein
MVRAPTLLTALALCAGVALPSGPALAQPSTCQEAQKFMGERQTLIQGLNKSAGKDKKLDPRVACGAFGKLVSNGETGLKWFETNKDWCQVPDQFVENFKADHDKIKDLRGKACGIVSKMEKMQNQARQQQQQQQQQNGNPFGGGLTGTYKIPQGAL